MKPLDLLFVTAPSSPGSYGALSSELTAIEPPVWSMLLANAARQRKYSVEILDAEALRLSPSETAQRISDIAPVLTVFSVYGQQPSASTQVLPGASATANALKEISPRLPTIALGTHPSALPCRTLLEEPFTFVCQGDGADTLFGLVELLKARSADCHKVPGLWYRRDGRALGSPAPRRTGDLDAVFPGQAWDLLELNRYRSHNWHGFSNPRGRSPYASLQMSLGCPYQCSFCCIHAPFGGPGIRFWSVATVLSQIDLLVRNFEIENIKIPDEMFLLNHARVEALCDGLIARGYRLNIWAYGRIDTIPERLLGKLRQAGFRWLAVGIESARHEIRESAAKGQFVNSDVRRAVKMVSDAGIHVVGNYLFGLPEDTESTMRETLELALELNHEWANFNSVMAYPGSRLYDQAVAEKWRLPDSWTGYSQHSRESLPLPTRTLSGAEVLQFRDQAFQVYYRDPRYLKKLGDTFGAGAVDQISKMLEIPIDRKHKVV